MMSLEVNASFLQHLRTLGPIPRKLHVIFHNKSVIHSTTSMAIHGIHAMKRLNPGWEFQLHDEDDMDKMFRSTPLLPTRADRQILLHAHIVEKSDAFRLLLMYHVGGFYQDVDRVYSKPLSQVLQPRTRMLLPTNFNVDWMQDIMCTAPGNELFLRAIHEQIVYRRTLPRRGGWIRSDVHMQLCCRLYQRVISQTLFGPQMSARHGHFFGNMVPARAAVERDGPPLILTSKDVWCSGIVVQDFTGCKSVSRGPLYQEYGVKAWARQVDARWSEVAPVDATPRYRAPRSSWQALARRGDQ